MSGNIGYQLRQHISKALTTQSKAIRTALDAFNEAARHLDPTREKLRWDQVVEYTFLSEFALLADCREDIRSRPWARPAARSLMDRFFKMKRAAEEVERVEVEAARLLTFIADEQAFLKAMEDKLSNSEPGLSRQIGLRRIRFELASEVHVSTLHSVGLFSTGIAVSPIAGKLLSEVIPGSTKSQPCKTVDQLSDEDQKDQEELEDDEAVESLCKDIETVMLMSEEPNIDDAHV